MCCITREYLFDQFVFVSYRCCMRLRPDIYKKIARLVLNDLRTNKLVVLRVPEKTVLTKIESVLLHDAKIEEDIDLEAKKTLEKFRAQVVSGEIEYHKMFQLVKKQLMKEKKFIP